MVKKTNKKEDITQYNDFADKFSDIQAQDIQNYRQRMYNQLPKDMTGLTVLDMGCGYGIDLPHFLSLGANIYGLDASEELIAIAKKNTPKAHVVNASFQKIPFSENTFDWVYSNYALQTVEDVDVVLQEVHRILKPKGHFVYLATHPLRQLLEKNKQGKDYYKKEVVNSVLFDGKMTIKEPAHMMTEYLNNFVIRNFNIIHYEEHFDPSAEKIRGQTYPGFMLFHLMKR